jgi:aconitase A
LHRRSFARIHQQNLAKQGMLALSFANEQDYKLISSGDLVSTVGLDAVLRGNTDAKIKLRVRKADGKTVDVDTVHSLSVDAARWILAGSCMNHIASTMG